MMYSDELRDMLTRIQTTQDELLKNQQRLEIALTQLQNSVPSRVEIQALLAERVSQNVYTVESAALKTRVDDLEERFEAQPVTVWNRASIVITVVLSAGAVIISLITLLRH